MIYGILIVLLIIIPIGIAYYHDYKQDPDEFVFSLKTLGKGTYKGLLYAVVYIGLYTIYASLVPLNKNHGIEFNHKRNELGIPTLNKGWTKLENEQFETTFWNPSMLKNGHFKKVIEYGILNASSEIDYYRNLKKEGTFAWSKYNFKNGTFEYFIERPNDKSVSFTKSGKLKLEKPTIIEKVKKSKFDKYISE